MANTLNLGNGDWATKENSLLGYNSENGNYKPLPFDFTRASNGTFVNKSGLIETAANGVPRIDFSDSTSGALLLEPQRTNLLTYSEDFSNASWTKHTSTYSNNTINASFGTGFKGLSKSEATQGIQSVYFDVEYTDHQYLQIGLGTNGSDYGFVNFDIQNKIVGTESGGVIGSIVDYGSFIRIIANINTTSKTSIFLIFVDNSNSSRAASTSSIGSFKIYRSQLEAGSYATSYIPTQGSAVTRVSDACSQTVPDGIIGQTEGTIYAEINVPSIESVGVYSGWKIDGTSGNQIAFITYPNGRIQATVFDSGSLVVNINDNNYGLTYGTHKIALAYKQNDYILYVDGSIVGSDTSATVPIVNEFDISYLNGGSLKYNETKLYNTRLSNAELAALTTI